MATASKDKDGAPASQGRLAKNVKPGMLLELLPELKRCMICGETLEGGPAYFHALSDGLVCVHHKRLASGTLSAESQRLAAQIFHAPAGALLDDPWPRERARDLRRFSVQTLERHLERKLKTAEMLARM